MRFFIPLFFLLMVPLAFADSCIEPHSGLLLEESATLCPGSYWIDQEMTVVGNGLELQCDQTTLRGDGLALRLVGTDLTVKACHFSQFDRAVLTKDATGVLWGNHFESVRVAVDHSSSNMELKGNTFYAVDTEQHIVDEAHYLAITAFAARTVEESKHIASYVIFGIAFFALLFFGGRIVEEFKR